MIIIGCWCLRVLFLYDLEGGEVREFGFYLELFLGSLGIYFRSF